jgi:hypothetical protein
MRSPKDVLNLISDTSVCPVSLLVGKILRFFFQLVDFGESGDLKKVHSVENPSSKTIVT